MTSRTYENMHDIAIYIAMYDRRLAAVAIFAASTILLSIVIGPITSNKVLVKY